MQSTTESSQGNGVVKSVGRVMEVFELLRSTQRPLTGTDVVRALGYPKSSANAILKSLVELGYLTFDRKHMTYFPSLNLTELGEWVPTILLGSGQTLNLLAELNEATSETVTLSMQNNLSMQFLRAIPGTFPISLQIGEGYMAPLFGTGVGTALLATKTDEEVVELAAAANSQIKRRRDKIDINAVLSEIAQARSDGFAAAYDRLLEDTGAIAMPMPQVVEGRQLVLAVAGLGDRIHRNEATIIRTMKRSMQRYFPTPRRT